MIQGTRGVPAAYDATEEEFDRLASRLAEEVDLRLEDIYTRADQRLEEVFARAADGGGPIKLRLEYLTEVLG